MKIKLYLILFLIVLCKVSSAQTGLSSDEIFQQARKAAFDEKNYPKAISLSKQALSKSPNYSDIRVFLGRLYTWSDKPDSARLEFNQVLSKHPDNEDAAFASGSLEYWNNNSNGALRIVSNGLKYHTRSTDLLLLKAKVLNDLKRYSEANNALDTLIKADPGNSNARALADRIKDNTSKNKVGVTYDYISFDKQFNVPWHLASVEYARQTDIGSIIGHLNYANRFSTNGWQYEIDAYPHISKIFYAYMSGGYSNNVGIFPKTRAGFSLYANLPAGFEAEGGFRYLHFTGDTWIYTASIGKYYKSFWFNFRTYLTPSNNSISQSYSLKARYYTGGADDYISLGIGTGISPDDPRNIILLNNGQNYKLLSNNITAAFYHSFKRLNIIFVTASLDHQEYRFQTWGNQLDIGIGYQRRF
ncbi:MAG TPA: YaiO family outer membrane beta-barrel protein [Mucilaginibacter sp.]|jgi:YaiO family outer membrane protein|nr:YaiO family outer membrane beta-barrel protein [Mucilaginibacter sp.]